jgi:alkylated DNA nucleotide flippase Atl1
MSFTSPPNSHQFNLRVWEIVRQIPPGRVMAYGQVGALIPPPADMTLKDYDAFKARWVGGAMAQCPDDVPWWRVIPRKIGDAWRGGQRQRLEAKVWSLTTRTDRPGVSAGGPDAPEQPGLF